MEAIREEHWRGDREGHNSKASFQAASQISSHHGVLTIGTHALARPRLLVKHDVVPTLRRRINRNRLREALLLRHPEAPFRMETPVA